MYFQIRILINQINQSQVDVKADLHALRLASFNQILDPWIYILFRKELFIRTFDCLRKIVLNKCKCLRQDSHTEEYSLNVARNDSKPKIGEIPFVKYEHDNAVLVPFTDTTDLQMTVVKNCSLEPGDQVTCVENHGKGKHKCVSRKSSRISTRDEEARLSRDLQGPNLHLKHSACLFCLSNHPKCVILSSKSMDGLNLLNDGTCCTESTTCTTDNENECSRTNNNNPRLRSESFHQSLNDMAVRADECV